jgi:hypothetical protein
MADLSIVNRGPSAINSIEDGLLNLAKYGRPRLSMLSGGCWYCVVEVFVTGDGVQFEVKSSMDDKSPIEAVVACVERLDNALRQIENGKK